MDYEDELLSRLCGTTGCTTCLYECRCIIDTSTPASLERDFHAWLQVCLKIFFRQNFHVATLGTIAITIEFRHRILFGINVRFVFRVVCKTRSRCRFHEFIFSFYKIFCRLKKKLCQLLDCHQVPNNLSAAPETDIILKIEPKFETEVKEVCIKSL